MGANGWQMAHLPKSTKTCSKPRVNHATQQRVYLFTSVAQFIRKGSVRFLSMWLNVKLLKHNSTVTVRNEKGCQSGESVLHALVDSKQQVSNLRVFCDVRVRCSSFHAEETALRKARVRLRCAWCRTTCFHVVT